MPSDWPQNAHPVTRVIGSEGTSALTFEVPAGVVLRVESVYAEFDTSGGAAAPLLTVTDDSGAVIARKRQTETADDPALSSATWALRLGDDNPGGGSLPSGFGLGASVERSAAAGSQVIAPNLLPAITFDNVLWASPGMVDLATAPTLITITVDGMWLVSGHLEWTGNAGDVDARQMLVDTVPAGSFNLWDTRIFRNDAFNFHQSSAEVFRLTAGTAIRLRALQRSAGNRNVFGELFCQWLGPLI